MRHSRWLLVSLLMAAGVTGCSSSTGKNSGTGTIGDMSLLPAVTAKGNVAILVVDDFGLGKDLNKKVGTADENCAIPTNDVGSGGADDDPPKPPYSHGELVYQVLKEQLNTLKVLNDPSDTLGAGAAPTPTYSPSPGPSGHNVESTTDWTYVSSGSLYTVRLAAVHVAAYRTADMIQGITDAIKRLHDGNDPGGLKFNNFVLNLSFVVIPCDIDGWLAKAGGSNGLLQAYNDLLGRDQPLKTLLTDYLKPDGTLDESRLPPHQTLTEAVLKDDVLAPLRPTTVSTYYRRLASQDGGIQEDFGTLMTVYQDSSWKDFIAKPLGALSPDNSSIHVIPVGAAGNGVWHTVSNGTEGTALARQRLEFPFAPALWDTVVSASAGRAQGNVETYSNSGEVALAGGGPAIDPGAHGTSFAAPRLSALEARYLLKGGACPLPLKYAKPVNYATTVWHNYVTTDDWQNMCADFLT